MGMPVEGSYTQDGFRFRNDDGSQTAATWLDLLNTNVQLPADTTFRLRVRVQQTVSGMTDNAGNLAKNFKVRFSRNGGAYTDVAAGAAVIYAASANVADGDATTSQLGGSGTYIAGVIDNNNDTGTLSFDQTGLQYTELEFVLSINSAVAAGEDTLDFRVYETSNVALNGYTATARLTVGSPDTEIAIDATEAGVDQVLVLLQDPPRARLLGIEPDGTNAVKVRWSHDNRPPSYVPGDHNERWPA